MIIWIIAGIWVLGTLYLTIKLIIKLKKVIPRKIKEIKQEIKKQQKEQKKHKNHLKKQGIKVQKRKPTIRIRRNINVPQIVGKIMTLTIGLYVGGVILNTLGETVKGTTSPFHQGLTMLGWNVTSTGTVVETNSGAGILGVIGIIGIAKIILSMIQTR